MKLNNRIFIQSISTVLFVLLMTFSVYSQSTLWSEDWEGNWIVDWHVDAGTWEVGTPTSGPDTAFSGQNCAATVLNGNYAVTVDSRIIRHTSFVVPSASQNPRLRFWHWYSFSSYDYGNIQISTDGGANWQVISTSYTSTGSGVWTYPYIDLSAYADSTVQIAFYFHAHHEGYYSSESTGWYVDDIEVISGSVVFNNPEGFEGGLGDWDSERGTWEVGNPTSGPNSAFNGQNCAATVLNGNYAVTVDSRLISPSFTVPSASQNPRLRFWHWYSFSSYDYGNIQISTDGGANWQVISTSYTSTGSGVWTYPYIDLSAYADSTVQIAFYFHAHHEGYYSSESTGWYVDDIEVISGSVVFNNPEGFEGGLGDWDSERGTWEVGNPTSGPDSAFNGQNCAATVLNGNYAVTVDSRLISPSFTVPSASQNPALQFWHWYNFSSYDKGTVEIKIKGDTTTWQSIAGPFINTSSGAWTPYYVSLSNYADSTVKIAFYFHAHHEGYYSSESTGWYIDDINIVGYVSTYVGETIHITPDKFSLQQNYPNPFNPSTNIRFGLPKASQVKIEVYDMLGQRVAELLNENKQAGYHTVQFDGRNFSSGVYFYQIQAGTFMQVRKMLLVR